MKVTTRNTNARSAISATTANMAFAPFGTMLGYAADPTAFTS